MGTVSTFDHTADVGLLILGDDLEDLFRTAAEGAFDYIVANRETVQVVTRASFELTAEHPGDLLLAWLNELIFLCETRHLLFTEFVPGVAADGLSLRATVGGEPIDRDRHELDHEVKAVTHHGLSLKPRDGGGWTAEVILDI